MAKSPFFYEKYQDLGFFELEAIKDYFAGNVESLAQLVIDGDKLSYGMREFLADMVRGVVKRKRGRGRKNLDRDFDIFDDMTELLDEGHTLRPNRGGDGAALEIAKKYNIVDKNGDFGEEAVIKIYQKRKKDYEEYKKIQREDFDEMMKEKSSGRQSDKSDD